MDYADIQKTLELTVFGPGYGESILFHYGDQKWIIVDSCIDPETNRPAALAYFEKIGINAGDAVSLIVATHWHDDHIRGLGEILAECPNAEFVFSSALLKEEFLSLICAYGERQII